MSPEAKRRCEELNNKHFHGSTVMDVVTESYQAGMQDPDANKELLEDLQDTVASLQMSVDFLRGLRLGYEQRLGIDSSVWTNALYEEEKLKAARGS